ncbi:lytic transglycosylase domain-containing protein [Azospira restricta]|uniref:Lytic transglycosylase domain-containing protein n=1 Tax=Azospira restricta TaxID=404405 RepID=A0A974SQ03_9RHOO|nr:lytic transglycosylase domain-containing protein [Azospira restricta]QRJ64322.1 lytic transglycosylase domain-containing protein [Azospira restricta]
MTFFRRTALLSALLFVAPLAAAAPSDERLLAARDAFRAGDRAKLERLAPELRGHDLEDYVDYWLLVGRLPDQLDAASAHAFLARHERTYLAEKLRGDWLKALGKQQQWGEFDAEYGKLATPDQELACYALQSRRARGDAGMLDEALPLWLTLLEPPEPCYPVLEALIWEKRVLADEVWARVRRQFEANRLAAARYSTNYLPPSQTPSAAQLDAALERPLPMLVKLPANWADKRLGRELAVLAIQRIAKNDPRQAVEQLEKLAAKLDEGQRGWAWAQIGWQAATRHLPEAVGWFRQAGDAPLSDEVAQWKVRAALRAQEWGVVHATIERMPPALAAQPEWIYWLGRAHLAGGRLTEAQALFQKISGQPNFYGNLADDELERPIRVPPAAAAPTRDELAAAAGNPGLKRALALIRLNMRVEGVREWNWTLRGMNDRQLLAAAELAKRNDVFDRAIAAADRTRSEHDYSLRYLAPFNEQVRPAAQKQAVDDAWVYGLMRQESRFISNARSSVGASGLMQLMPATAKWVAKKIGLANYHHGNVNDTETNLLLGTSYMRMVMDSLDNHPVLASAAYNAGPGRARKWRAERPLEGAIYAETIPFNETRDYVKKVMSNSVYYAALFEGRPQTLKPRLGVIGPRAEAAKGEDLP